ncbi:MAG TPA: ATP-binding protein [bacterium]|nr:ATP-binding protein [bacterium]
MATVSKHDVAGRYCVIDDESAFLEVARARLSHYLPGLTGSFTSEPSDALKMASTNPRILYIIDVRLGAQNGIDLFNDIARISPRARVIFITGDTAFIDDENMREKALSRGGIDFIEKPVKWHELAIKIQNHLKLIEYQFDLEEKVQERTQMLIHADRLATIGTMVSSIVHEVNSPLTFIKANQETILLMLKQIRAECGNVENRHLIDKTIVPSLNDSIKGVRQIEDLLKSFRRFYKQEKTLTAIDIMAIIEDVRTLTLYNIRKQSIVFTITNRSREALEVWGNKQELIQAVTNIVNNAIDAFEGSAVKTKRIEMTLEKNKDHLVMTISNNGPKIPQHIADNIFEPFFTTKSEEKGTGLGLVIVRQIMKGMGGDIMMRNKDDDRQVVEFICTIPLYRERKRGK